jgi:hypothetical protein
MEAIAALSGVSGVTHTLYEYQILDKISDIRHAAGSCYYPVHMADVIK